MTSNDAPQSDGLCPDGESVADRLNRLFEVVHPPGRGEFSNREVAEGIRAQGGETISVSQLHYLRTGERTNPRRDTLEALATFFKVSPSYFFSGTEGVQIAADLEELRRLRASGVQRIAARTTGLSDKSLKALLHQIEHYRDLEGLPPDDDTEAR